MSGSKGLDWQLARERLERAQLAIETNFRTEVEFQEILRQRAAALAFEIQESEEAGETILVFRLTSGQYAVPLRSVVEVTARPAVAPAPGTPPSISGLMQVRGEIRVVWNLNLILGLPPRMEQEGAVALLLRTGNAEAAVLVDEVDDIRTVKEAGKLSAPEGALHAAWMTDDLIIVLDTERLWSGESADGHERTL
jgi:purine-binding chemotaxis protein CheW